MMEQSNDLLHDVGTARKPKYDVFDPALPVQVTQESCLNEKYRYIAELKSEIDYIRDEIKKQQ
jgi:hypothetical protein